MKNERNDLFLFAIRMSWESLRQSQRDPNQPINKAQQPQNKSRGCLVILSESHLPNYFTKNLPTALLFAERTSMIYSPAASVLISILPFRGFMEINCPAKE